MTPAEKELMKKDRLHQYEANLFMLEMDLAAAKAVGDKNFQSVTEQKIEDTKKAYAAVESMTCQP